jgi:hypothetical protein
LRAASVAALRGDASELGLKLELDRAIALLELCERYALDPRGEITVLPEPLTRSPSSELRLMEDHESEDRTRWTEVVVDGRPVRPAPGDLLLARPAPPRA